jgi:hypothetical protein
MELSAITNLRREWEHASASPRSAVLLSILESREPDIAIVQACSLAALVTPLQDESVQAAKDPWRVTAALLRQFDLDELIGLGLVARLLPGLLAIGAYFEWGHGAPWYDPDVLASEMLCTTWETLHRLAGKSISYPERTVLRLTKRQLGRQRSVAHRRIMQEESLDERAPELSDPLPVSVLVELTSALRVHRSKVTEQDLWLIYQHRVLGFNLPELAAANGTSLRAMQQRSWRAEAAICA